jgi:hypothetical protein
MGILTKMSWIPAPVKPQKPTLQFTLHLECRDESKDVRAGGADDLVCEVRSLQDLERLLEVGEPLLGWGRLTARYTTHGLPNYSTVKKVFH